MHARSVEHCTRVVPWIWQNASYTPGETRFAHWFGPWYISTCPRRESSDFSYHELGSERGPMCQSRWAWDGRLANSQISFAVRSWAQRHTQPQ